MQKAPKIRFDGYTEDWEHRKLSELLSFSNGFNGSKDMYGEGIPYISVMDILSNDVITYDTIQGKVNLDERVAQRYIVEYGDILFQRSSENIEDAGRSNVYVDTERTAVFGGFVIRGKKVSEYDPIFMKKNLETHEVRNQITSRAQGAQHINVGQETLGSVKAYFPSLNEQKIIGNFFQTLDSIITLHQKECEKMLDFKKYMLNKMFPQNGAKVPEIRFKDFTEDWEQRKFGDLGNVSMCKRIFKEQTSTEGDIPFYKIGTFGGEPDAYITRELYEEYKEKFQYPEIGDMLISASGTIGRIVEYTGEDAYFQDSNIVWFKHDERVDNSFLKCIYAFVKWSGIEGSTIKRLYNDNFLKTEFYMSSVEEQKKIGSYFSNIDHLITLHQRKVEAYKKMKQYMLRNMFV